MAAVQDGGGDVGREFRQADDFAGVAAGHVLPPGNVADGAGLAVIDHSLPFMRADHGFDQRVVEIRVRPFYQILTARRGDHLAAVPPKNPASVTNITSARRR